MPLQPKLSKYSLTPGVPRLVFTDQTGAHDPATNPGGYGGPNPERTALAVVLLAIYNAVAGPQVLPLQAYARTLDAYDPATPPQYILPWPQDGWFRLSALYFPVAASPVADQFAEETHLYDTDLGYVVVRKGEAFEKAEETTLADHASFVAVVDDLAVPHNTYRKIELGEACTNLIGHYLEDEDCRELEVATRKYNIHAVAMATIVWTFCRGEKFVAQGLIETLNKYLLA